MQALFRPRHPAECDARLQSLGLPAAGGELVVRRTVQREGRSRAWVNGALATAAQLQAATRGLLDISGQHEHVGLLDAALHLDLLDAHAQLGPVRAAFSEAFAALAEAEKARAQLDSDERSAPSGPTGSVPARRAGEGGAGGRRGRAAVAGAKGAGRGREAARRGRGGRGRARRGAGGERRRGTLEEMATIDPALERVAKAVRGASAELDEAARELSRYAARAGGDSQRLEELDERIEVLRRISRKHGGTLASALQRREQMRASLRAREPRRGAGPPRGGGAKLAAAARSLAEKLSRERRSAAAAFRQGRRAGALPAGDARANVGPLHPVAEGAIAGLGPRGLETAELLLSPNPGEELRPLSRIASGGELSRVLLAVKRVLAGTDPVDSYLFDEVDAGIGGATADAVGRAWPRWRDGVRSSASPTFRRSPSSPPST